MSIVITIRGGVVENVFSTSAKIKCTVIDWDETPAEEQPKRLFPVDSMDILHPDAARLVGAEIMETREGL